MQNWIQNYNSSNIDETYDSESSYDSEDSESIQRREEQRERSLRE